MTHQSTPPRPIADYFRGVEGDLLVAQAFYPGRGWKRDPHTRKRVSGSYLRKLRADGATEVSITVARDREAAYEASKRRSADFQIAPMFLGSALDAWAELVNESKEG